MCVCVGGGRDVGDMWGVEEMGRGYIFKHFYFPRGNGNKILIPE